MRTSHCLLLCAALAVLHSRPAFGQQPDVIRGTVTGPGGVPIAGALVVASSVPDSAVLRARTDSAGRYTLRFPSGSRHYWLAVSHAGVAAQRREIVRAAGDSSPFVADFSLRPVATQLAAVVTSAPRRRPAPSEQSEGRDPGSTGEFVDVSSGLTRDVTGDLASALATLPDVTVTPGIRGGSPDVSAFGLTDTGYRLNGMAFAGARVPRDGFRVRGVTNTYDPGVGGFAGAALFISLPSGSTAPLRTVHYTEDNPALQFSAPVPDQLGNRYTQRVLSGAASGPIASDRFLYNVAYQLQQRSQPLTSLLSAADGSLVALGITPDSVAALVASLPLRGVPTTTSAGTAQLQRSASIYSRFDFHPHGASESARRGVAGLPAELSLGSNANTNQYSLLLGGGWTGQDAGGVYPTALPTTALESRTWNGAAQAKAVIYLGDVLNEATISLGESSGRTTPDVAIPNGRIFVASGIASDGSAGASTMSPLDIGGSVAGQSNTWSSTLEAKDEVSWYTRDGRHKIKLTGDATMDRYTVSQAAGAGAFTFASLTDFEANRPASFTRTVPGPGRVSRGEHAALGIGDQWTVGSAPLVTRRMGNISRPLQLSYGLRLEGDRLLTHPDYNPVVDSLLGLRTDRVPSGVALLPMLGFQKPFGTVPWEGGGGPRGLLRGGIREYRGAVGTRSLDPYLRQTGLPSGARQIACVGAAAPTPTWSLYTDPESLPDACLDGSAAAPLAVMTPPVSLYASDYQPTTSWREQLDLFYNVTEHLDAHVGLRYARNRQLASRYDLNFDPTVRFNLAEEGGRPVFIDPSNIDAGSGIVSSLGSRRFGQFSQITETRSDMASEVRQLTMGANWTSPAEAFATSWSLGGSYTYSHIRDEQRGFTGSTATDPRLADWAPGAAPVHRFILSSDLYLPGWFSMDMWTSIQSGYRYTPLVSTDILGVGFSGTRAFVFDPARGSDAALAEGMQHLLSSAPASARSCLLRQLGTIARRNSCTSEWSSTLDAVLSPDVSRFHLGNRARISAIVTNVLAGADQLFHGSGHLHGWGQPASPDVTLLDVRGFDPVRRAFIYDVNASFGGSSVARNVNGEPFQITLDMRVDFGPDRKSITIASFLSPRPADRTASLNADQIRDRLLAGRSPGVAGTIMRLRDSLQLTQAQVDSMQRLQSTFDAQRERTYADLARFLAARNGDYDDKAVRARWHEAIAAVLADREQLYQRGWALLSDAQRARMPKYLAQMIRNAPQQDAMRMRMPIMLPP